MSMAISTPNELIKVVQAGNFDQLVGTPENDWLDFKRQPYRLDMVKDRWELVKDVAAFANHQGGMLVIGVQTDRQPHEAVDVAVKVRPVPFTSIDPTRYHDLLIQRIYPPIRGLQLKWHLSEPAATKGLFVITVPPQPDDQGPFIVHRTLDEDGRETTQAFAIPQREGAVTLPLLVGQMHRLINDGLRANQAAEPARKADMVDLQARADERLGQLEEWQSWESWPVYFLQALPPAGTQLSDLHEPDGLRGAVEHMDVLRLDGFNLRPRYNLEVRDGALAYLADPRRVLRLDPDGMLTVGALATYDYLGWAMDGAQYRGLVPDQVLLNSIVVVEFTLEFFRLVHRELLPRTRRGRWTFRVICRRMQTGPPTGRGHGPTALGHGITTSGFLTDTRPASSDAWDRTFQGPTTSGADAFSALRLFYELFGQPASAIPFVVGDEVSEQEILQLGS